MNDRWSTGLAVKFTTTGLIEPNSAVTLDENEPERRPAEAAEPLTV